MLFLKLLNHHYTIIYLAITIIANLKYSSGNHQQIINSKNKKPLEQSLNDFKKLNLTMSSTIDLNYLYNSSSNQNSNQIINKMPLNNNNNSTSASLSSSSSNDYEEFYKFMQQLTGLYLLPLISVLGIVGNLFMIVVYKESKKYSTNFYLIALSFSDIIKLLNDFMYFLVSLINKLNGDLGDTIFVTIYNYSHYIFIFSALNTSWLTCAIAFDRYISVISLYARKRHNNYLQSIIISMIIFILSIVLALPSPFFIRSEESFDIIKNKTVKSLIDTDLGKSQFKKFYQYVNGFLRAVIPFLLLVYLNACIIRRVYQNKMKQKSTNAKKKTKSSVTLMLITIVLTFTLCIFPDAIMTMMQLGYANETSYLVRGIREITDLLLAINSAVPFPICFHFSIEFRTKFKQLFSDSITLPKIYENNDSICGENGELTTFIGNNLTSSNKNMSSQPQSKGNISRSQSISSIAINKALKATYNQK